MAKKLPVLFIAHGSPMNIILDNDYTKALNKISSQFEKPKGILVISAHWKTRGTFINISDNPKQIYDFYGFPEELYNIKYNVEGSKDIALKVLSELKDMKVMSTESWGLDHGAWGILKHIYNEQDIPVFQLSLNGLKDEMYHYELGKRLGKLREEGILIIGSGNIVHSFSYMKDDINANPPDFAVEFQKYVRNNLVGKNYENLINYKKLGEPALKSVPTDEHYLPLLCIVGAKKSEDKITFIYEGFQNASMSMTSFMIG